MVRPLLVLVLSLAATAAGAPEVELVVIVNPSQRTSALSRADLFTVFTSARRQWDDGAAVVAFNSAPDDDTRHAFDRAVLRMTPDEVARFWIDQRVRSGTRPPRQVPDPRMAVRAVAKLPGAIAYVRPELADGSVRIVARIVGGGVVEPVKRSNP